MYSLIISAIIVVIAAINCAISLTADRNKYPNIGLYTSLVAIAIIVTICLGWAGVFG
jgi:hypothetical protein